MFGRDSTSYIERVDVIGNPAFLKFVEQLEKDEDITLDTFDLKDPVVITTIAPSPPKLGQYGVIGDPVGRGSPGLRHAGFGA